MVISLLKQVMPLGESDIKLYIDCMRSQRFTPHRPCLLLADSQLIDIQTHQIHMGFCE